MIKAREEGGSRIDWLLVGDGASYGERSFQFDVLWDICYFHLYLRRNLRLLNINKVHTKEMIECSVEGR